MFQILYEMKHLNENKLKNFDNICKRTKIERQNWNIKNYKQNVYVGKFFKLSKSVWMKHHFLYENLPTQ